MIDAHYIDFVVAQPHSLLYIRMLLSDSKDLLWREHLYVDAINAPLFDSTAVNSHHILIQSQP